MSNNLLIGTGGCGNKLANVGMDIVKQRGLLNSTYDFLFVNSNVREMNHLSNFNPQKNGLVINGNGTGRNRIVAKESMKYDRPKISSYFAQRVDNYHSVTIASSADGGFGSGSVYIIANVIRQLSTDIKINILVAMPKLSSRKASLENAISLYEDLIELLERNIIDSVQFINNDKMTEEDSFNENVMNLVIDSLELNGGSIDENDTLLVNSTRGYKVIFPLSDKFRSVKDSIDECVLTSPFVLPSYYKCTHLCGILNTFNKEDVLNEIPVTIFDKCDYGDIDMVVLGGCALPDEHISMLEEALKDLNNHEIEEISTFRRTTENTVNKPKTNQSENTAKKPLTTEQKMKNIMSASFWD